MSDLRVALLGYGLAGRAFHAPVLTAVDGLALAAVVTGSPERAAQAVADHPGVVVLPDADALWRRADEVDVVVVATPNAQHAELALCAIGSGLPVVVDKPLARSAAEAREVVSAATSAGVLLTVFHNRRWDSDTRTARQLLQAGAVGQPWRLETRFERWRPVPSTGWRDSGDPEQGGGLLLDLGSHQVDQALHLLGAVTSVYAEVDQRRAGVEVEDDVMLALTHAGGCRSTHWLSATAAHLAPRLRLLGSRAALVVDDLEGQEAALRSGRPPWGLASPTRSATGDAQQPVTALPGDYRLFYAGLRDALLGRGPVPVDPAEAVAVLEVLDAARSSAATGQVVHLV